MLLSPWWSIFCFFLITINVNSQHVSSLKSLSSLTLSSAFLSKKNDDDPIKNVPINQTYFGFYVNADISDATDTDEDPISIPMQLALYTSSTLLAAKNFECQEFYTLDCDIYSCIEYPNLTAGNEYPYFTAKGHLVSMHMYLEASAWNLNINATYATDCHQGRSALGTGTYGLIGLGVDDNAWNNFLNLYPIFSIYIDENVTTGTLYFGTNMDRATTENPIAVLPADSNWHISNVVSIEFGLANVSMNTKMIFDMNADSIGIPLAQYQDLLSAISNNITGLTCPTDASSYYRPVCNYTEGLNVSALPNLTIYIGNQKLDISPDVYIWVVRNTTNTTGRIQFSLQALSSSLTGNNYISPIYNKYVILDSYTMSYYYMVFDGVSHSIGNNTIQMYYSNHTIHTPTSNFVFYLILTIASLMLFILAMLIYFRCVNKRSAAKKRAAAAKKRLLPPIPKRKRPLSNGTQKTQPLLVESPPQNPNAINRASQLEEDSPVTVFNKPEYD